MSTYPTFEENFVISDAEESLGIYGYDENHQPLFFGDMFVEDKPCSAWTEEEQRAYDDFVKHSTLAFATEISDFNNF